MSNATRTASPWVATFIAGISALTISTAANAASDCDIIDSVAEYYERKEQAIILMQYEDLVVRATGGEIRCEEDKSGKRQVCMVNGQGEILVEGGDRSAKIIRLNTDELGEVHIYASGDLSCALKSEFDRYR